MSKKLFFILSGPSGVGKSSLLKRVLKEYPNFRKTISYTTRKMRQGEQQGHDYHFLDKAKFLALKAEDFFLEDAKVYQEFYGTSRENVENLWSDGYFIIKDLDVKGAQSVKKIFKNEVKTLFISPPNMEELKKRFMKRGDVSLQKERVLRAEEEMKQACLYDYQVINDDFESCWIKIKKIIETLKEV